MDKLIQMMEALRTALEEHPLVEGGAGAWWLWHDGGTGVSCPRFEGKPGAQLAHDVPGRRRGRVYLATDWSATGTKPALRGIVVHRASYGVVWEVDDGRGLVEAGSARRQADVVDPLWRTALRMLGNPARIAHVVLQAALKAREDLSQLGRLGLRPGKVSLGGELVAYFGTFPSDEADRDGVAAGDGFVVAREVVSCSALAHQACGVMLHAAKKLIQGQAVRPRTLDDADREVRWAEAWRPDDPPAAMRDAAASAQRSAVDGRWRKRLEQHLQRETEKKRTRRQRVVDQRLQGTVHLPPDGADPTGKSGGRGWYGAEGADRLPIPTEVVAALWVLGFGGRTISEIVVGSTSAKSAMSRRIKEVRDGRDDLEPTTGAALLERLNIDPRPAAGPGAPAGREPTVKVSRRGKPPFDVYLDGLDDKIASFVCNLPERQLKFLELLYRHGEMTTAEMLQALDLSTIKALGGLTGSIARWAPVRGVPLPYERTGTPGYRWVGFPAQTAEDAA